MASILPKEYMVLLTASLPVAWQEVQGLVASSLQGERDSFSEKQAVTSAVMLLHSCPQLHWVCSYYGCQSWIQAVLAFELKASEELPKGQQAPTIEKFKLSPLRITEACPPCKLWSTLEHWVQRA
eukprot:1144802-Pelagomonas_calceolata.AAC.3